MSSIEPDKDPDDPANVVIDSTKTHYRVSKSATAADPAGDSPRYHGYMLGNIGPLEIAIVLIIALIVFGPKRLPELGSSLGRGIREFRNTVTGDKHDDDDDDVKALSASQAATTPTPVEKPSEAEVVHDKRS
jgi:sec-independent protein translocase protein TatA